MKINRIRKASNFNETTSYPISIINNNTNKRRIVTKDECCFDNKQDLGDVFRAFHKAIDKYNERLSDYPIGYRVRNIEAVILNQELVVALMDKFQDNCRFGKYKRFIFSINGYHFLVKKLDGKNMPMNISTRNSISINNQMQLNLFKDEPSYNSVIEPLLYIGYKKNKFGIIGDLKVVYIDENKLQWTLTEEEFNTSIFNTGSGIGGASKDSVQERKGPILKDNSSQRRAE